MPAIIRLSVSGGRATAVPSAKAPSCPVEGGLPTAALLAHVGVSTLGLRLPLERQLQMLAGRLAYSAAQ